MLNELYTFAEPVQVVPFSSLKWGKFTLLHTDKTKWTQYTASFDLSQTSVTRWELGRKARYYISLDTAVDLEGVIADWVDIDYMEGTFLPR